MLVCLIIILLFYLWNKRYEHFTEENVKILHLVLFSRDSAYDKMYEITRNYYKKFNNVKTVYYLFDNSIEDNYKLVGDILYVKGVETYIPGILDKTMRAFEYFNLNDYDYVVRSNVSTIVNFDLLSGELDQVRYGGGLLNNLGEQLKREIANKEKNFYASGTSMIFSVDTLKFLLNNQQHLDRELVDDLAIGLFFYEHSDVIPFSIDKNDGKFIFVFGVGDVNKEKNIFYRNRTDNRDVDVAQMGQIVNILTVV